MTSADRHVQTAPPFVVPPRRGPFSNRRRFLVWALMIGAVPPQRLTERVLAEIAQEMTQ